MLWQRMPDWHVLSAYMLAATVVAYAGRTWFMATRKGFADVL